MRTKIVSCNDKDALMIYTDKQERYTQHFEDYLNKVKMQYEDVVIFVSGDKEFEPIIHTLIYDKCTIA